MIMFFSTLLSTSVFASSEKEKTYLVQLINQIDAMRPMLV
jgi:hypothetical protein